MTLFIPVGRLTQEPSTRQTGTGRSCCSFNFAVDTGVKDSEGNKITNFLSVTAWGKLGELAQQHLHKGDAVSITGKFCARPFRGQDGTTKMSLDLTATDIDFLPGGKKDGGRREDAQEERSQPQQQRRRKQQAQPAYEDASDDEDAMPF